MCYISSDQLKIPKHVRESDDNDLTSLLRSLDTLVQCHEVFLSKSDGNLKKAKFHFNVIGEAFFLYPLTTIKLQFVPSLIINDT